MRALIWARTAAATLLFKKFRRVNGEFIKALRSTR
jgi:hypothetical protein